MLKRYAFTFIFSATSIISIFCFYLYVNADVKEFEQIRIETVSGDEREAKKLEINGVLSNNDAKYLFHSSTKRTNINPINYWNRTTPYSYHITELQEQYKSFMREKINFEALYEDSTFLFYGEFAGDSAIEEIKLDILEKRNKTSRNLSVTLPDQYSGFEYGNIEDVQLIDQEISVVLKLYNDQTVKLIQGIISASQEKLISIETVYESDLDIHNDGFLYFHKGIAQSKYILFNTGMYERDEDQDTKSMFYIMDVEKGDATKISIPQETMDSASFHVADDKIYYIDRLSGTLYKYDPETKTSQSVMQHDIFKRVNLIEIKDDRVLITEEKSNNDDSGKINEIDVYIIDLVKGEEVYHGRVDISGFETSEILYYEVIK